jgi:hypothetical protein
MFSGVHRWLVDSPLWVAFVIAPLFSAFVLYVAVALWNFFKVKPQQLNIWILKARLAMAESRLHQLDRLLNDQRYLIAKCLQSIFYMLISILLSVISSLLLASRVIADEFQLVTGHESSLGATLHSGSEQILLLVLVALFYGFFAAALLSSARILRSIMQDYDRRKQELTASLAGLEKKLRLAESKHSAKPNPI